MKIPDSLLPLLAAIGGIGATGCWVLTQADGAITSQQGPVVTLIQAGCIAVFCGASFISAQLTTKGQSRSVMVQRALFLMGVSGVVAVLFFGFVSLGRIFLFGPLPTVLLAVFALMVLSSRFR